MIKADILDSQAFAEVAQDAQIAAHTAALLGVREVIQNALYTLDVNYIGTSNLLKIVLRNSRCERLVFFSTSEILGSNAFRIAGDGILRHKVEEEAKHNPDILFLGWQNDERLAELSQSPV